MLENWAAELFKQSNTKIVFTEENDAKSTEARIWQRLVREISSPKQRIERPTKVWLWPMLVAAACVSVVCGYFFIGPDQTSIQAGLPGRGVETKNTTTSAQKIFLADGSTVFLEEGANIVLDENYGKKNRTVYLTGEAFFEVRRNEKVPFLVYSGGLVTEVLGTSFHIKPQGTGRAIEVSVETGRVSVYASQAEKADSFDGVILTPNQKVLFDPEFRNIRQGIVETPRILTDGAEPLSFNFREASIETTVDRIRTAYGVDIVLPGSGIGQCKFTGNLSGLSMYDQLKFVCESVGARFETRGATIFILGEGCN